ncbi:hypothetical protein L1987_38126 [Smallanthus sonchifolius]|uniref:Uncharacterized protein n=1 Tax=Smallanthus sonchifolius TaxID=185202 RepID=A0ACB9HJ15_9ASTR|nr:hypothetical protein L1987_38126 [Smallanthus sonchifolius]
MESKRRRIENAPLTSLCNQDDTDADYSPDQDLISRPRKRRDLRHKQVDDLKGKQAEQSTVGTTNDDNDQGGGDAGSKDQGDFQDDTQRSDPFNFDFEGDLTDPKDNDSPSHLYSTPAKDIQDEGVESSSDS